MQKSRLFRMTGTAFVICTAMAIAASAQTYTTLYSFAGPDGSNPDAGLIQATDGNFYGTTNSGGTGCTPGFPCGTVFKITAAGVLTTLYNFCSVANCNDGAQPNAGLIQGTDGNFYGTTTFGGGYSDRTCAPGCGTVFKITPAGALTTMHSFCSQTGCADGTRPLAGLIQATDGNFYGTTWQGGAFGNGTVFKINPAGTLTTLYSFCSTGWQSCPDGASPAAGLVQATDGNFYGTTNFGGANGMSSYGTVFSITAAGTQTTLHSFVGWPSEGAYPNGLIQAADGNFYGTTYGGGSFGTVFKVTSEGTLTTLYSFCVKATCLDGKNLLGTMIRATDGNFYGTTSGGGAHHNGTIFEITSGGALATVYNFCPLTNCPDGSGPAAGLVQAADGTFYGTTSAGGTYGVGTVFRLSVAPAVTLTSSLTFPGQALNESSTARTATLRNIGTALLNISGIAIEGNFAISANTCGAVLLPQQACKVSITFTPTVLGKLTGTLTVTDNAPNNPQIVSLLGTGVLPATLMPSAVTFASQTVGATSVAKTFTLTNNQNVSLNGLTISTTGDFAISTTTCTTSLAAKSKCTIGVTFTPTATGTRKGQLSASDSASNSPQTSSLTGTGK